MPCPRTREDQIFVALCPFEVLADPVNLESLQGPRASGTLRRDLSVFGSVRCLILRSNVPVTVAVPAARSTSDHLSAVTPPT